MKSVLQNKKECFICHSTNWLELHHIFGASNKKNSEKYGLIVYLCHWCHNEPPNGVHHNAENMKKLRSIAQKKFEEQYTRDEFRRIFGKNYLD